MCKIKNKNWIIIGISILILLLIPVTVLYPQLQKQQFYTILIQKQFQEPVKIKGLKENVIKTKVGIQRLFQGSVEVHIGETIIKTEEVTDIPIRGNEFNVKLIIPSDKPLKISRRNNKIKAYNNDMTIEGDERRIKISKQTIIIQTKAWQEKELVKRPESLRELLEMQPDKDILVPEYLIQLGLDYIKQGNYEQAIQKYQEIIDSYPNSRVVARAQYYIGQWHYRQGQKIQARDAFQKVIDNYPDSDWANKVQQRSTELGIQIKRKPRIRRILMPFITLVGLGVLIILIRAILKGRKK